MSWVSIIYYIISSLDKFIFASRESRRDRGESRRDRGESMRDHAESRRDRGDEPRGNAESREERFPVVLPPDRGAPSRDRGNANTKNARAKNSIRRSLNEMSLFPLAV